MKSLLGCNSRHLNSYGSTKQLFTIIKCRNYLTLQGGTGVHSGGETTNIVTDITADDTMSFLLNDNITVLVSFKQLKYFQQVELL